MKSPSNIIESLQYQIALQKNQIEHRDKDIAQLRKALRKIVEATKKYEVDIDGLSKQSDEAFKIARAALEKTETKGEKK